MKQLGISTKGRRILTWISCFDVGLAPRLEEELCMQSTKKRNKKHINILHNCLKLYWCNFGRKCHRVSELLYTMTSQLHLLYPSLMMSMSSTTLAASTCPRGSRLSKCGKPKRGQRHVQFAWQHFLQNNTCDNDTTAPSQWLSAGLYVNWVSNLSLNFCCMPEAATGLGDSWQKQWGWNNPPSSTTKKSQGNTYSIVRSWPGLWLASIDAVDRLACKLEGGLGSEWKWNICERVTGCYTVEAKYGAPGKRNSTDGPSIEWMWWRRIFSINGRSLGFTRLDLDLNLQKFWNMTDLQYYSAGWQHGTTMCSSWETGKPGGRSWGDQLISQQ